MNRVIKDFAKFDEGLQEEIYEAFYEGSLERTKFPFRGEISDGVIFQLDETLYLIPTVTIKSSKLSAAQDLEEDDDTNDSEEIETADIDGEEDEEVDDEE